MHNNKIICQHALVLDFGAKPLGTLMPRQWVTGWRGFPHLRGLPRWLGRRRLRDHPQIVGDAPPADPPLPPSRAVGAAPLQFVAALQAAEAPGDARPPLPSPPAPALLCVAAPLGRRGPGCGQDPVRHAVGRRLPRVGGRVHPALPWQQARRALQHPPMMVQARRQGCGLGGVALQHGVPTDAAAFHRVHPQDAAACGGRPGVACAADRGVRRAQAHDLLSRRPGCAREDPAGRLGDALGDQRDYMGPGGGPRLALRGGLGGADRPHAVGVLHGRRRAGEQTLRRGAPPVRGLWAPLPRPGSVASGAGHGACEPARRLGPPQRARTGCGQRPAQHPHASIQPRALGRMLAVRRHHRPSPPPLPAPGDPQRPRQEHDLGEQPRPRLWGEQGGPAPQRRISRHRRGVHPATLPPHQPVTAPALGGLLAPPLQRRDHQPAEDDLDRGGRTPVGPGPGPAAGHSRFDRLAQGVVVEPAVQWRQDRVQRHTPGRDTGKQMHGCVAIPQPRGSSLLGHVSQENTMRGGRVLHQNRSCTAILRIIQTAPKSDKMPLSRHVLEGQRPVRNVGFMSFGQLKFQ
jgi:hypothetical protein